MKKPKPLFHNIDEKLERIVSDGQKIVRSINETIELFDGKTWYPVEFSRCDSHEKICFWIDHLSRKPWITPGHISLFMSNVFSHFPLLAPREPASL